MSILARTCVLLLLASLSVAQAADDYKLGPDSMEQTGVPKGTETKLTWKSVRWVTNQEKSRWGSCTPSTGAIRLSHRLAGLPPFVIEYVLVHELAHLVHASHGPEFWALVNRYPKTERARGYLMALGGEDQEEDM